MLVQFKQSHGTPNTIRIDLHPLLIALLRFLVFPLLPLQISQLHISYWIPLNQHQCFLYQCLIFLFAPLIDQCQRQGYGQLYKCFCMLLLLVQRYKLVEVYLLSKWLYRDSLCEVSLCHLIHVEIQVGESSIAQYAVHVAVILLCFECTSEVFHSYSILFTNHCLNTPFELISHFLQILLISIIQYLFHYPLLSIHINKIIMNIIAIARLINNCIINKELEDQQLLTSMNFISKYIVGLCSACGPQTLLSGVTDVIVVRSVLDGCFKSTPFYACFGTQNSIEVGEIVEIYINGEKIQYYLVLDENGYVYPRVIPGEIVALFGLAEGRNEIIYKHNNSTLAAEVYLYDSTDKLIVSDFDGTLTKSDIKGLYSNLKQVDYLHDDYSNLMAALFDSGYKVVWMTMRSLPLYSMTKEYAKRYLKCQGPIIMQPQQALLAIKKESIVRTSDLVKATVMKQLRELFPSIVNPFAGGFGNRDKDAIAYHFGGMRMEDIYIIDVTSIVQKMSDTKTKYSYSILIKELDVHFPRITKQKNRLYTNKGMVKI